MWAGVNILLMDLSGSGKRGYHHGDLRNALGEAAAQLAREGGPEAVTVRAAARLVGVTPTAAYRHYAGHEELLREAKNQSLTIVGMTIEKQLGSLPATGNRVHLAVRNLVVAGRTYIEFALAEPGLFRTAFSQGGAVLNQASPAGDLPFGLLVGLLDELVAVGFMPAEHRELAEVSVWSAAHGLAMLLLDGPLRDVTEEIKQRAIDRTMLAIGRSVAAGPLTPELRELILNADQASTPDR
jgi:AcrR family transcriptional regulator